MKTMKLNYNLIISLYNENQPELDDFLQKFIADLL